MSNTGKGLKKCEINLKQSVPNLIFFSLVGFLFTFIAVWIIYKQFSELYIGNFDISWEPLLAALVLLVFFGPASFVLLHRAFIRRGWFTPYVVSREGVWRKPAFFGSKYLIRWDQFQCITFIIVDESKYLIFITRKSFKKPIGDCFIKHYFVSEQLLPIGMSQLINELNAFPEFKNLFSESPNRKEPLSS